jgi:low temperature requirement protein LtrA
MSGRDPHEQNRVATPLELLFDLTFAVAFGVAAEQLAHALSEKHIAAGLEGFAFCTFAICWGWINFSWFASAYDTDDWIYRLNTMLQMVGVIVLGLGIPSVYSSLLKGQHLQNQVMVAGYVIMRVAMVAQWLRAARQDPGRRPACLTYAAVITVAQIGWVALILAHPRIGVTFLLAAVLVAVEMTGPWLAETRKGGTPWHARHIADRYAGLAIIALGEGVVGTVASLSAVVADQGWSLGAVLVAVAGTGLTFGMWWIYYLLPMSDLLRAHRERSFTFGYLHVLVFGAIVGTGAGLRTAGFYVQHHSALGSAGTVASVAIPVGAYIASLYLLFALLTRTVDPFHAGLLCLTAAVLIGAVALAASGTPMAQCLLIVTLAPAVTVLGFETVGHRHAAEVLARSLAPKPPRPG